MTMTHRRDARRYTGANPQENSRTAVSREIHYQADAASYVAAMIAELRQISGKAGFEKLVGALDTAYYEAYSLLDPKSPDTTGASGKTTLPLEPTHS